jgi:hypothetical protein
MAWLIDITIVGIVSAIIVPFTAFTALLFFPVLSWSSGSYIAGSRSQAARPHGVCG